MSLTKAHEGYEYQDLLATYFILQEILNENNSEFKIDKKEFKEDKLDDLIISNNKGKSKHQIKYSNADSNHTLNKSDLSGDSTYHLSLDGLYETWLNYPSLPKPRLRLCLSWNAPDSTLENILCKVRGDGSFADYETKVFQVNLDTLWPEGQLPLASWKRLRNFVQQKTIKRGDFFQFCQNLLIEVELPKFSLNLGVPGDLETLVLNSVEKLGIGIYPNQHYNVEAFTSKLILSIKRARSKGNTLTTNQILHDFNIRVDFGSIAQTFPINEKENVTQIKQVENVLNESESFNKILILGEPGSGKSWFLENLQRHIKSQKINVIRHYCYTSLDDTFQKERITLNTFYGNLIADIVKIYPELKSKKEAKYASNLSELNVLLQHINTDTYLIIDGLDHIERVFNFYRKDLTEREIEIIENISLLNPSKHVKIVIASQNIARLTFISSFHKIPIPSWSVDDTRFLLKNNSIEDLYLKEDLLLSSFIHRKSGGNPLYLKYLIEEVRIINSPSLDVLNELPEYSYNLVNYYKYLIEKIEIQQEVPRILSGINFRLTKHEINEITFLGLPYVEKSLTKLYPILKGNFSQSGYIIYHESFRRFMVDNLKENSVDIEMAVFKPIIDWFETKDFFAFPKACRFYFQLLYECGKDNKILKLIEFDFVTKSALNGHSWKMIIKNHWYAVKAAINQKHLPKIILLNELNKILAGAQDSFEEHFFLYIKALGSTYGFNNVSDYLLFEGKPSLGLNVGLQACYVCESHGVSAPWITYLKPILKKKKVTQKNLKYVIRGLIILQDSKRLRRIARVFVTDLNYASSRRVLSKEICLYKKNDYIIQLAQKSSHIRKFLQKRKSNHRIKDQEILSAADKLLNVESIHHKETELVKTYIKGIQDINPDTVNKLIDKFKAKNWFYNWLIYYIKIQLLIKQKVTSFEEIKKVFDYLIYDLEPFKGKPRTCDLYFLRGLIYQSLKIGLRLIKEKDEWKQIIDTLVKISERTTTSIQGSISGPLSTDYLFSLLSEFVCENNLDYVLATLANTANDKQEYQLHTYIAEYHFNLSILFAKASDKENAKYHLNKGVEYALAYTMRKDSTINDLVTGIDFFYQTNPKEGKSYIPQIKALVDSVVDHTDGKGTWHFPNKWFKKYLSIDQPNALLYLLHELSNYRYSARDEDSLVDALVAVNGTINLTVEAFLVFTLPIASSEPFLSYSFRLAESIKQQDVKLSEIIYAETLRKVVVDDSNKYKEEFLEETIQLASSFSYQLKYKDDKYRSQLVNRSFRKLFIANCVERIEFPNMSMIELREWIQQNTIGDIEVNSFYFLFETFRNLTDELKDIIKNLVIKDNRNYDKPKISLDNIFISDTQISCYYWVCRFFYDVGGWFEKFINVNAFKKAHNISAQDALAFLFELLPEYLQTDFNSLFSAHLMRLFVELQYDQATIAEMWKTLFEITSYRLPNQENVEWDLILSNELSMNTEEVLICILITRLKANTQERDHWVISGLSYLMDIEPNKLVKPFKWFLRNHEKFIKSCSLIIMQLIYKQVLSDASYLKDFQTDIQQIYPTNYVTIDFLIEKLLKLPFKVYLATPEIHYTLSNNEKRFYNNLNVRFGLVARAGLKLGQIFAKYSATYNSKYSELFELYVNRMYETMANHIYCSDYLLELLNTGTISNELKKWAVRDECTFLRVSGIALDTLTAQTISNGFRPNNLLKPSEYVEQTCHEACDLSGEWVRIAHYEYEQAKHEHFKLKNFKSYGGVVFTDDGDIQFPYSVYQINPSWLWNVEKIFPPIIKENPIVSCIQIDPLENFKILWLNPYLVEVLKLKITKPTAGLCCIDSEGSEILKFRAWKTDYLSLDYHTTLHEEIPLLSGSELIIRKDYFYKLCEIYKMEVLYFISNSS